MPGHIYVDESKRRGYLVAAVAVPSMDLKGLTAVVRSLVLPRQRRLHMTDESDKRRRTIVDSFVATGITSYIYDAGRRHGTDLRRRVRCLDCLVADAAVRRDTLLVLDRDDTMIDRDNQCLIEATRRAHCRGTLRYEHRDSATEPLLALPDAVAWCWARGGEWRRRIRPVVSGVRDV